MSIRLSVPGQRRETVRFVRTLRDAVAAVQSFARDRGVSALAVSYSIVKA